MSEAIIRVSGIGKRYRLKPRGSGGRFGYRRFTDAVLDTIKAPLRQLSPSAAPPAGDEFWALRDVSFDIRQGEVVGVIGRNGAGKSTLLKILSRITEPTRGRIEMEGRIASLLEVGTGFHPELTGRENIFLNGAILGMTRVEITRKFDEIVAFAEVERFLDTPVKHYSSGMYVRLAFAVAAHLEPEILVVDEVLAVGDADFQRKCLGKMQDISKGGRTVLFVSHNMTAITRLCSRCLVLEKGGVAYDGVSVQAVTHYLASAGGQCVKRWTESDGARITKRFRPVELRIVGPSGQSDQVVSSNAPFVAEFTYELPADIRDLRIGFYLQTAQGDYILTTFDGDRPENFERWGHRRAGRYVSHCTFPANWLMPGAYVLGCNAGAFNTEGLFTDEHALRFTVEGVNVPGEHWGDKRQGCLMPFLEWQCAPEAK